MSGKQYSVATPIELESGKTIWVTVGRAFEGEDTKYAYKITLSALPVTMFTGEPLDLFLFEAQDYQPKRHKTYHPKEDEPPPPQEPPGDAPF